MRGEKICPVTSFAASEARNTASGAFLSGVICMMRSTRRFCSGVSAGMVPVMRDQAKGAMQFDRTLKRDMSSAIDFDSPTMPSFAAE